MLGTGISIADVTASIVATTVAVSVPVPVLQTGPSISTTGKIGQVQTYTASVYDSADQVEHTWLLGGVPVSSALSYTPPPAADLAQLVVRSRARNNGGAWSATTYSAPVQITYVAPTAQGNLPDINDTVGNGPWLVNAAADIIGSGLTFAISGGGSIDPQTGQITHLDQQANSTIIVTVTNSGGSVQTGYQINISAGVASSLVFGVETPVGEGAAPTTAPDGTYGPLTASGGQMLLNTASPSPGTVTAGGETWTLVANQRSVSSLAELTGALNQVPLDGSITISMRAGNHRTAQTYSPPARQWTAQQQVVGEGYVDAAFVKDAQWACLMPCIQFQAGTNGVDFLHMSVYADADTKGARGAVVEFTGGPENCGLTECEIHSSNIMALMTDGDAATGQNHSYYTLGINGVNNIAGVTVGGAQGTRMWRNYIHDCYRGLSYFGGGGSPRRDTEIRYNVFDDMHSSYFTAAGRTSGLTRPKVWNNLGCNILHMNCGDLPSIQNQTGDAVSATNRGNPHSSIGASADPRGDVACDCIDWRGNILIGGSKRVREYQSRGWIINAMGWSGSKINDANYPSYANYPGNGQFTYENPILIGNILAGRGSNGYLNGCDGITVVGNAFVSLNDPGIGGSSVSALDAVQGAAFGYNLAEGLDIENDFDGESGYVTMKDHLQSLPNIVMPKANGELGWMTQLFTGHSTKGFLALEVEDLVEAFTPVAGSLAERFGIGPNGHALFDPSTGNFLHDMTPPAATQAVGTDLPRVSLTGTRPTGSLNGPDDDAAVPDRYYGLFKWFGNDSGVILSNQGDRAVIRVDGNQRLAFELKNGADTEFELRAFSTIGGQPNRWNTAFFCYDGRDGSPDQGRFELWINGIQDAMVDVKEVGNENTAWRTNTYLSGYQNGTSRFTGGFEVFALHMGETMWLNDPGNYAKVFAGDGMFADLGVRGANLATPFMQHWIGGDETTFDNLGAPGWSKGGITAFAAPEGPAQIGKDDYTWTRETATSMRLTIVNAPDAGDQPITGYEYSINNNRNAPVWVATGLSAPGSIVISGLDNNKYYSIELRAITSVGASKVSPRKVERCLAPANDVTAPLLTNPAAAPDGTSAFSGSIDTNEGNGTLYWVAVQSGVAAPDQDQVIAGQNGTGAAAVASANAAVGASGSLAVAGGGLSGSTQYVIYYVHVDGAGNKSDVAASGAFTTATASAGPITSIAVVGSSGGPTEAADVSASTQSGDLIIGCSVGVHNSGSHTFNLPAGYAVLGDMGTASSTRKQRVFAKIADATDAGTSISGLLNSANGRLTSVIVLRANRPLNSFSASSWQFRNSTGAPPPRTVAAADQTPASLVVGFYSVINKLSNVSPRAFTGMPHLFEERPVATGSHDHWIKGALVATGATPVDVDIAINNDHGGYNILGALALAID